MAFPHLSQPVAQGVRVLDADPDLGTNLHGERFEQARQALVARTEGVGRGAWRPDVESGPDSSGGIGILVLACLAVHLYPRTSILGAVLLTGFLGGAIASQVRIEAGLFSVVFPVILGAMIWGGLYLRDERLRTLVAPRD